jgi:hypothetical protein
MTQIVSPSAPAHLGRAPVKLKRPPPQSLEEHKRYLEGLHSQPNTPSGAAEGEASARDFHEFVPFAALTQDKSPCHSGTWLSCGAGNTCGPASLASVLNYFGIGWGDIPVASDGAPDNEAMVRRVCEWARIPDTFGGMLGTSPGPLTGAINALNEIKANLYWGGTPEATQGWLIERMKLKWPTIVLAGFQSSLVLDWQIPVQWTNDQIDLAVTSPAGNGRGGYMRMSWAEFHQLHNTYWLPNVGARTWISVEPK